MKPFSNRRQSAPLAISVLALFFAMGGGAYAAGQSLISGTQIKPHSVTLTQLSDATVKALRGPSSLSDTGYYIAQQGFTVNANSTGSASAMCAGGKEAVSGGYLWSGGNDAFSVNDDGPVIANQGSGARGWRVGILDASGSSSTVLVYAVCENS